MYQFNASGIHKTATWHMDKSMKDFPQNTIQRVFTITNTFPSICDIGKITKTQHSSHKHTLILCSFPFTSPLPVMIILCLQFIPSGSTVHCTGWQNYTALPRPKEPTDIFGEIELSLGNGQGWWYLPYKLKNIQLP